ncbi:MAG: DUF120 domain-containing protein [Promethearchaeota archaeon]
MEKEEIKDGFDEKEWFLLLFLAKSGAINSGLRLTTQQIADLIGSTQQTISRRLKSLIEKNLVERIMGKKVPLLKITERGINLLKNVYFELKNIFNTAKFSNEYLGTVITGMGEGAYYIGLPHYKQKLTELIGKPPFLGTLNVELNEDIVEEYYFRLRLFNPIIIEGFKTKERTFGEVRCYWVNICDVQKRFDCIRALLLDIQRTSHKKGVIEIVSEYNLRNKFGLKDGSKVIIKFANSNEED